MRCKVKFIDIFAGNMVTVKVIGQIGKRQALEDDKTEKTSSF